MNIPKEKGRFIKFIEGLIEIYFALIVFLIEGGGALGLIVFFILAYVADKTGIISDDVMIIIFAVAVVLLKWLIVSFISIILASFVLYLLNYRKHVLKMDDDLSKFMGYRENIKIDQLDNEYVVEYVPYYEGKKIIKYKPVRKRKIIDQLDNEYETKYADDNITENEYVVEYVPYYEGKKTVKYKPIRKLKS